MEIAYPPPTRKGLKRVQSWPIEDIKNLPLAYGRWNDCSIGTRVLMYIHKGTACVRCGIKAVYFASEKDKTSEPHLNVYAIKNGRSVLMTRDHIIPKSKGGGNGLKNSQPMCARCNEKKADKTDVIWYANKMDKDKKYRIVSCHGEHRIQIIKKKWFSKKQYWVWHVCYYGSDGFSLPWGGSLDSARKEVKNLKHRDEGCTWKVVS